MLDRGGGGGAYLTGGFNIGFTVYFTIIEVKKIIRRFFISRFHCIYHKGLPLYSLLTNKYRFVCYVCRVALADNSTKLRILIIYMFRFCSYRRCSGSFFFGRVSVSAVQPGPQSSLSRNLVSLKAVKDSGLL